MRSAIVISASSDIGSALCRHWLAREWNLLGTYRRTGAHVTALAKAGVQLVKCDLAEPTSVRAACHELTALCGSWDVLVLCPGQLDPIGPFPECDFDEWASSFHVNFTAQLHLLHGLLPFRRIQPDGPAVLFFAGGGTNSAPRSFSAYSAAKIALIKMCELLDTELPDTTFVIVGPGWVRTKIHEATLRAGVRAGDSFRRTQQKLAADDFTPMERVLACCDWAVSSPRELVGGRNFSVAHDAWGTPELNARLAADADVCKLRRHGNDLVARRGEQG